MAVLAIVSDRLGPDKVKRGRIKDPYEAHQPVGDIYQIYESPHYPTSTAQRLFDFIEVKGMTRAELIEAMPYPEKKIGIRDSVEIEFWREKGETEWKQYKKRVKFELSIIDMAGDKGLTEQDKQDLESNLTSSLLKTIILQKLKNRVTDYIANQTLDKVN